MEIAAATGLKAWFYARFDAAYQTWKCGKHDLSVTICYELLLNPATPDYYRGWSHLILALTPDEEDETILYNAARAEELLGFIARSHPHQLAFQQHWSFAKEVLESVRADRDIVVPEGAMTDDQRIESTKRARESEKSESTSSFDGDNKIPSFVPEPSGSTYRIGRPMRSGDLLATLPFHLKIPDTSPSRRSEDYPTDVDSDSASEYDSERLPRATQGVIRGPTGVTMSIHKVLEVAEAVEGRVEAETPTISPTSSDDTKVEYPFIARNVPDAQQVEKYTSLSFPDVPGHEAATDAVLASTVIQEDNETAAESSAPAAARVEASSDLTSGAQGDDEMDGGDLNPSDRPSARLSVASVASMRRKGKAPARKTWQF